MLLVLVQFHGGSLDTWYLLSTTFMQYYAVWHLQILVGSTCFKRLEQYVCLSGKGLWCIGLVCKGPCCMQFGTKRFVRGVTANFFLPLTASGLYTSSTL